jgi:hypothetical protein
MENLNFEKRPKEKIPKKEGQYEKIEWRNIKAKKDKTKSGILSFSSFFDPHSQVRFIFTLHIFSFDSFDLQVNHVNVKVVRPHATNREHNAQ